MSLTRFAMLRRKIMQKTVHFASFFECFAKARVRLLERIEKPPYIYLTINQYVINKKIIN